MRIGLTGGIATGKSTVAAMLRALGAVVIDADAVARRLQEPGAPGWRAVWEAFGWWVLDAHGRLQRKKLGRLVFSDPRARQRLDAVMHPLIRQALWTSVAEAEKGTPLPVVVDLPLLFEVGWESWFDQVWVVTASPEVQRARLMARDGLSCHQALARIAAQWPQEEKRRRASRVFENDGDLTALRNEVEAAWRELAGTGGGSRF